MAKAEFLFFEGEGGGGWGKQRAKAKVTKKEQETEEEGKKQLRTQLSANGVLKWDQHRREQRVQSTRLKYARGKV